MGIFYPVSSNNSKNPNKRIILDMVRFTPGGISRAELARQIGLTRSAVSTIVNEAIADGLVRESESGPATGGRRPTLLEINPQKGNVIGIDMGATHLGVAVADFAGHVLDEVESAFNVEEEPQVCLDQIQQRVREILSKAGIRPDQILAIGMGVPGPVMAEAGLVSSPPIMPGWDNYPIREQLRKFWQVPVTVNNDAELGALGEWAFGAARGEQNLAYIKVGSGVGAGLLLDGRIFRGATGCAGEIGHITVLDGGPRCSCGNSGCLEALSGGKAIARRAREAISAGKRTQLSQIIPPESITARDVANAARYGDLVSQQIVAEAGAYLGIAVAGLVNLFNPNVIVVGGGVAQMGDLLLEPIRRSVQGRSLPSAARAVRILAAVLGRRSTTMGAVVQALSLAMDSILDKN